MDTDTIIWIVVAAIVLLALLALAAAAMKKKKAQKAHEHRARAQELRTEAAGHVENVGQAKVGAKEAEARAERARLEAERADQEAAAAKQALAAEKEEYEQRLRDADRLDPDVNHKAKDYSPTPPTGTTTTAGSAHTTDDGATSADHTRRDAVRDDSTASDSHDGSGGTHAR